MKDDPKSEQSFPTVKESGASVQRPRSPRVPVAFEVVIEGRTTNGESFQQRGEAVKVSRGGATLITSATVEIGARVRLTPPFGRSIDAEVNGIWTDEADGKQRIGIKLLDQNGWFAE
jgi:hypothetical protein